MSTGLPIWSEPIPDVVGTILAARAWCAYQGRLYPIFSYKGGGLFGGWEATSEENRADQPWGDGWKQQARCRASWPVMAETVEEDHPSYGPPPVKNCSCGFWGLTSATELKEFLRTQSVFDGRTDRMPLRRGRWKYFPRTKRDSFVLGVVEMWGKVVPGSWGWRSQYARVAGILATSHPDARKIARDYRVPLLSNWPELTPPYMQEEEPL